MTKASRAETTGGMGGYLLLARGIGETIAATPPESDDRE
jgi:hypothetical protein